MEFVVIVGATVVGGASSQWADDVTADEKSFLSDRCTLVGPLLRPLG